MISKKLLSEVLGVYIQVIKSGFNGTISTNNEYMYKIIGKGGYRRINIYQLAFLVRDYLLKKYNFTLGMNKDVEEILETADTFYAGIEQKDK